MSEKELREDIKELTKTVADNRLEVMTAVTRLSTQMEPVTTHFAAIAKKRQDGHWYTSRAMKTIGAALAALITAVAAFLIK